MRLSAVERSPMDESLILPIAGRDGVVRDYVIEPVDAEWWLRFAALRQVASDQSTGRQSSKSDEKAADELGNLGQIGMREKTLGVEVAERMLVDGVSSKDFQRAVMTAFTWHATGCNDEAAAEAWGEPDPKESEASTSSSTAGASTTKRPARTTTTTSRRKSSKK